MSTPVNFVGVNWTAGSSADASPALLLEDEPGSPSALPAPAFDDLVWPPLNSPSEYGACNIAKSAVQDSHSEGSDKAGSDIGAADSDCSDVEDEASALEIAFLCFYVLNLLASVAYTSAVIAMNGPQQQCGNLDLTWYSVGILILKLAQVALLNGFMLNEFQLEFWPNAHLNARTILGPFAAMYESETFLMFVDLTLLFLEGVASCAIVIVAKACPEDSVLLGWVVVNSFGWVLYELWLAFVAGKTLFDAAPLTTACCATYTLASLAHTLVVWYSAEVQDGAFDLAWYFVGTSVGRILILLFGMVNYEELSIKIVYVDELEETEETFRGFVWPYLSEVDETTESNVLENCSSDSESNTDMEDGELDSYEIRESCFSMYVRLVFIVCCFDMCNLYLLSQVGSLLPDSAVFVSSLLLNFAPAGLGCLALLVWPAFRREVQQLLLGRRTRW